MAEEGLLTSGVLQGSIIGHLLFLICVNDLSDEKFYSEYADNTSQCVLGRDAGEIES